MNQVAAIVVDPVVWETILMILGIVVGCLLLYVIYILSIFVSPLLTWIILLIVGDKES